MCGIAGIVGNSSAQALQQMLAVQSHRGPDYTGLWSSGNIHLGHNRLSIIDLSAAANQPMTDHSGRYTIVLNGEIYNYIELKNRCLADTSLHSSGDTEVLLELWAKKGKAILNELVGMFAFAVYDNKEKNLTLARDRFGVKPCYYSRYQNQFYFASEINTLWAAGISKTPREDVWSSYFSSGNYGLPEDSFWENIYQLPAAHLMEISVDGKQTIEKWYDFAGSIEKQFVFEKDQNLHDAYIPLLKDALSLRFRSDVPVGFTLSGGLDSSLLLAGIDQLFPDNKGIKAFTFNCGHKEYDELPWAQQLVAHTKKQLEPVYLNWQSVPDAAKLMATSQAEPYGAFPTLAYGELFKQAGTQGFTVMLDGQGMDEAWAGYDYYFSGNNHLIQGSRSSPVLPATLNPDFFKQQQKVVYETPFNNNLQNLQYRDLFYTKIPRAVRFNDRASMIWSVELREPFLDHRLVEFAFAQSIEHKHRNGQMKWMLRTMAEEWLGNDIAFAPKRPIQTPQREWLRNELKEWANDNIEWLITAGNPGWFEPKKVRKGWQDYAAGEGDNSFFVWQWINTALLFR